MLLTYNFSATKGRQWGREIYTFMCPLNIFDKLTDRQNTEKERFEGTVQLREDRVYRYVQVIKENRPPLIGEAVILSVNDEISFKPIDVRYNEIGIVSFAMNANKAVIAGHELKTAIRFLLEDGHDLQPQTVVPVVIFSDPDFSETKRHYHQVMPLQAPGFVERIDRVELILTDFLESNQWLLSRIDTKNQSLAKFSKRFFLKKQLVQATEMILEGADRVDAKRFIESFWLDYFTRVDALRDETGYSLRQKSIFPYGTVLEAMCRLANERLKQSRYDNRRFFDAVNSIDWSRENPVWADGVIHESGRILKNKSAIERITQVLEEALR